MANKSWIAREKKRRATARKYAAKRQKQRRPFLNLGDVQVFVEHEWQAAG